MCSSMSIILSPRPCRKRVRISICYQSWSQQAYPRMESKALEKGESRHSFSFLAFRSLGIWTWKKWCACKLWKLPECTESEALLLVWVLLAVLELVPSFRLCWQQDSVLIPPPPKCGAEPPLNCPNTGMTRI